MDENTVANVITISRSAENERFFAKLISRAMYPSCVSLFWTLFLPAFLLAAVLYLWGNFSLHSSKTYKTLFKTKDSIEQRESKRESKRERVLD